MAVIGGSTDGEGIGSVGVTGVGVGGTSATGGGVTGGGGIGAAGGTSGATAAVGISTWITAPAVIS